MQNPRWMRGDLTTGFIAEEFPDGFSGAELGDEVRKVLVTVAAAMDNAENSRRRRISNQMGGRPVRFAAERIVHFDGTDHKVELADDGGPLLRVIHLAKKAADVQDIAVQSDWRPGLPVWNGQLDGHDFSVQVTRILNGYRLSHHGVDVNAFVYTKREAELAALMPEIEIADTSKMLLCPMPGLVVSIGVKKGQTVKTGEALCIVEAMKMENILRAERDCKVAKINCGPGDRLAVDEVLMEFE